MAGAESKIVTIERRLDELEETIDILGDSKMVRSIERGLKDLRAGRIRRYESVETLFKEIKSSR